MVFTPFPSSRPTLLLLATLCGGCAGLPVGPQLTITMLAGSALAESCQAWSQAIDHNPPRLGDGTRVRLRCRTAGSGDVVSEMETHARSVFKGGGHANDPAIPTLVSVDGEIYLELLRHRLQGLAPGRDLIPAPADAPALAHSPMVLMTTAPLAQGLRRAEPYQALARSRDHRQLDGTGPSQPIRFVHTAPTRSNSGLQTLVAMVAEVSGKRPEQLTIADVRASAPAVGAIQKHVTRYGNSTDELARAMQRNGVFWASVGSVYESSVVSANGRRQSGQDPLVAVYPRATFSSTMRAILPTAPWVSSREREGALALIERLQQPDLQRLLADRGLRPANPSVPPSQVTRARGVDPAATYDSLRAPRPEVVEAIISQWLNLVKKPSRVALVVDTSGSMAGAKLPAVQRSLQAYLSQIGPRDVVGLIDFDSEVRPPAVVQGGPGGSTNIGPMIARLQVGGSTRLHDAVLAGRNWLRRSRQPGEILAVVVLTDGVDSGSTLSLDALQRQLRSSGFEGEERIAVFTIGYGGDDGSHYNANGLRQIAESNGGEFVDGKVDSIRRRMEELQMAF
ncbi:MAG: VWA domain-containing protein [Cyanobacteriota bacterium]|nr:VWA domain-containing protein [Cyanobacteriota bacterium]